MIKLADIEAASQRIRPLVRRTPLMDASGLHREVTAGNLKLKLECMQPSGSFKARGASNKLLSLSPDEVRRGLVAASGGNHGLAVARSAFVAGVPATLFLPANVTPEKIEKIRKWGANPIIAGNEFDEANAAALDFARREGAIYFHSFADPLIVAGQGTVGLEIMEDAPETDVVVIAVGGGGFITGAGVALKALKQSIRVIGVEPVGSPTLHDSLAAGEVMTLAQVTTRVPTMACRRTDEKLFELTRSVVDEVVLVEDDAMQEAADWLWFEFGLAADLSGAAAVAALAQGKVSVAAGETVTVPVCGAGLPAL
ncbi:pyridoxal-phosphate dependent enzyme [Aquamicrobium sp. LC103]|uniref:threonine ammonia-lyase n=1 Tax=Aquamicrobium sp. LC103 TaxID=1120658 RepID=UPI00063ED09A|nr:pyridoxal-phosphate dependent enzyme [Aquamicrobium sp. LC103]TKT69603.1 pyridoxal-phosphate dependent enzyme [Aquamicrobium sp. LC103]